MHTRIDLDLHMHTGIACHVIPICMRGLILIPMCIRGFDRSPYAYGDSMTHNRRMHMGIKINPRMHMEIAQTPVCIRGFNENPYLHTGIARHVIPLCIWGLLLIPVCIQGFALSPYAYRDPMTHNPCMHTGICAILVCIQGLILIPIC